MGGGGVLQLCWVTTDGSEWLQNIKAKGQRKSSQQQCAPLLSPQVT